MRPDKIKIHKIENGATVVKEVKLTSSAAVCMHEALLECEDLSVKLRYEALLTVSAMNVNGVCVKAFSNKHFKQVIEANSKPYKKERKLGKRGKSFFPGRDAVEISASEASYIRNKLKESNLRDEGYLFKDVYGRDYISLLDAINALPRKLVASYYEHKPEEIAQELGVDYEAFMARLEEYSRYPRVGLCDVTFKEVILKGDLRSEFEKVAPILGIGMPPHLAKDARYAQAAQDMYPTLLTKNKDVIDSFAVMAPCDIYVRDTKAKVAYDMIEAAIKRKQSRKPTQKRKKIFGLF